ncbi:MAG: hypothetical protein U1E03_04985 [Hyphomonadaceae bacterium]
MLDYAFVLLFQLAAGAPEAATAPAEPPAATEPTTPTPGAAPESPAAQDRAHRRRCTESTATGSRLPVRRCSSDAVDQEMTDEARDQLQRWTSGQPALPSN